jgi:hypothetical protein
MKNIINILTDFSEYPKLRYCDLSDNSAEKFYHNNLNEKFAISFQTKNVLEVNIDNTAGYTSSFLDEAFGNLVYDFSLEIVNKYLKIISTQEPYWLDMIYNETFKQWEDRRINNQPPRKTIMHFPWYRLVYGKLENKIWINNV